MGPLVTAVTALRFIPLKDPAESEPHNTLFAGIGNQLHVLRPGTEQAQAIWAVFPNGERVHGFSEPIDNRVIVTGGRYLSIVHAKVKNGDVSGGPIIDSAIEFDDWLWGSRWIAGGQFLLVACGHSKVWVCDAHSFSPQFLIRSSEKELTWSTTLFLSADGIRVRAATGTSFGDILIWNVLDAITKEHINELICNNRSSDSIASTWKTRAVHRLHGHNGPVMELKVSQGARRMASASVDRTVRVWETCKEASCQACSPDGCFLQKFVHYGHLARVWDVSFLQEEKAEVVSVAEDRTCRVWSGDTASQQIAVYRGHAGKSIWSLDVQAKDNHMVRIATGGEDGCVKIRAIPLALTDLNVDLGDAESSTTESCGSRRCTSATYEIPDMYVNPRKNGGAHNESGRSLSLLNDREMIISTDFGRILQVTFDPSYYQGRRERAANEIVSWIELHRDVKGVAYTPSSLTHCNGLIFAGQTNGNITVLKRILRTGQLPSAVKVCDIAVFLVREEMVMGLSAASSQDKRVCNLFAATVSGELFHWKVNLESSHKVNSVYCNTYRQENPTKTAVVTSVAYIAELDAVIVGDRGGRLLVYDEGRRERLHENGNNHRVNGFVVLPSNICRPHQDRVSTISQCSLTTMESEVDRSKNVTMCELMTGGFDGSMSRIQLSATDSTCSNVQRELSLKMVSKQKSIERVDTIGRLIFPLSNDCGMHNEQVFSRQCVVGFRSAHVIVWDMQQRNEIFRKNCGNWRRAYDVHLDVRCNRKNGKNGRLTVEKMRLVFWRSGRLHIVRTLDVNQEDAGVNKSAQDDVEGNDSYVQTIGAGFHGQRANTTAWFEGTDVFVTGSEDTTIHITRLKDERWETIQKLSRHISGVNCVSWIPLKDSRVMLFSGGGSDEVVGWISHKPEGPWKDVCGIITGRRHHQEMRALQRVMCIVGVGGDLCQCVGGCGIAIVGRSDGSIQMVRMTEGKGFRLVGKEWDGQVLQSLKGHKGAVLSCAGKTITVDTGKGFLVLTGDSRGDMGIWWIEGGKACEQREIKLLGIREGVHGGGLNDVDIAMLEGGKIMVVSGGDDERVRMGVIKMEWENGVSVAWAEWNWTSKVGLHCAAVTGICIVDIMENEVVIVSVGADQRVNWMNVRREGGDLSEVVVAACERSNVSDVGAVCGCVAEKEKGEIVKSCAVVCGCGMEAVWKRR